VQKWTVAKPFRISRRPGGSELNRRLANNELEMNISAFCNIQLSNKPGLGLDLNKDVAMKYLVEGEKWWGWNSALMV